MPLVLSFTPPWHVWSVSAATPPPVLADMLATQVFGLLRYWLDRNMPDPPEEMAAMFHRHDLPSRGAHADLRVREIDEGGGIK